MKTSSRIELIEQFDFSASNFDFDEMRSHLLVGERPIADARNTRPGHQSTAHRWIVLCTHFNWYFYSIQQIVQSIIHIKMNRNGWKSLNRRRRIELNWIDWTLNLIVQFNSCLMASSPICAWSKIKNAARGNSGGISSVLFIPTHPTMDDDHEQVNNDEEPSIIDSEITNLQKWGSRTREAIRRLSQGV